MSHTLKALAALIGGFAALAGVGSPAEAAVVQPCQTSAATGPPAITFLPINGGGQTYCQSAFGWSDTWFAASQPATYDQNLDVLSGDNAPTLTIAGATSNNGNIYNVIGPWLDGGTLNSHFLGSNWTVVNDISVPGGGPVGTSKIALGLLQATITTTVGANGVTEAFHFTNTSTTTATGDILFDDYYNFHANGSLASDIGCPTTTFINGTTAVNTGSNAPGCSAIVSNGTMTGSKTPLTWDLGLSTDVLTAMAAAVAAGNYNGFNKSTGPFVGDGAVDTVWDLGTIPAGASTDFTITKNFVPTTTTPEPASLALLGTGLLGLALVRRRRNRV